MRSRMIASGLSARARVIASRPLSAAMTRNPSNSSASRNPRTMCGSSSTTRIVFLLGVGPIVDGFRIPQDCPPTTGERETILSAACGSPHVEHVRLDRLLYPQKLRKLLDGRLAIVKLGDGPVDLVGCTHRIAGRGDLLMGKLNE